jgi:hypothetical protein
MNLREHVVLGAVAAVPVAATVGLDAGAAFWASSVLLDVDHYWEYLVKNGFRDWSWRKTFAFHHEVFRRIERPELLAINLFHTVEWLALVYVAGRWWGSTVAVAALGGMLFHLALDLGRLAWMGKITIRVVSIVEYVIRRRRLVRRGLDPDVVYREALAAIGLPSAPWIERRVATATERARETSA